jgi:plasmid maintenance system antidote protein VapI
VKKELKPAHPGEILLREFLEEKIEREIQPMSPTG